MEASDQAAFTHRRSKRKQLDARPSYDSESFDTRTLANMKIALDRACANVLGGEKHRVRRHVAARIARCAKMGRRTLAALSQAGQIAASELRQREPVT